MQGYNFTERLRKVLAMAREEALARNNAEVAPEHILCAIAQEGSGVAAAVLQNLGVGLDDIIRQIDDSTGPRKDTKVMGPDLPYSVPAKKVLEHAMAFGRESNYSYVGTEQILVGILRQEKNPAAQLLTRMGVGHERVRSEVLRLLDSEAPPVPRDTRNTDIDGVSIEIRKKDGTTVTESFAGLLTAIAFLQQQAMRHR